MKSILRSFLGALVIFHASLLHFCPALPCFQGLSALLLVRSRKSFLPSRIRIFGLFGLFGKKRGGSCRPTGVFIRINTVFTRQLECYT